MEVNTFLLESQVKAMYLIILFIFRIAWVEMTLARLQKFLLIFYVPVLYTSRSLHSLFLALFSLSSSSFMFWL